MCRFCKYFHVSFINGLFNDASSSVCIASNGEIIGEYLIVDMDRIDPEYRLQALQFEPISVVFSMSKSGEDEIACDSLNQDFSL
jgi:hypothetical protein